MQYKHSVINMAKIILRFRPLRLKRIILRNLTKVVLHLLNIVDLSKISINESYIYYILILDKIEI